MAQINCVSLSEDGKRIVMRAEARIALGWDIGRRRAVQHRI